MNRALVLTTLCVSLGAPATAATSFVDDIAPILTRKGCAGANCHGSVRGKADFKLSLFNSNTSLDYKAVLKDDGGRRVDLENPKQSLILQKPTFEVAHGGGQHFEIGSPEYETILSWLSEGAPYSIPGRPTLENIEVSPAERILVGEESNQQLKVTGTYSNGSRRDLTRSVRYLSTDDTVAIVDESGKVTAQRRGEAAIMVRTLGLAAVSRIAVINEAPPADYPEVPRHNVIDELVFGKLDRLGVVPSVLATDEVFVRRAFLDTIGVLPTPEETRRFLDSEEANKRARLIDELIERPEYPDFWGMKLADLYQAGMGTGIKGAYQLSRWLRDSLRENKPYDRLVRDLLMGSGPFVYTPTPNYYVGLLQGPEGMATQFSQAILGVRLQCAKCHDHPFERWSRDDFYGLAAFFSRLERKEEPYGRFEHTVIVRPNHKPTYDYLGNKELKHPVTGEYVPAKFLGGPLAEQGPGEDPRPKLAEWVSDPSNPFFARAIANRIWKHYMGRGIVEGVDDFRITNPPSNDALLAALASYLVEHDFNLKELMRLILNAWCYQLSAQPNDTNQEDTINYSRFYLKRLMAETLFDAMGQVAGKRLKIPGQAPGDKAIDVFFGSGNYYLGAFGKPMFRDVICERDQQATVAQALHLVSGDTIQELVTSSGNIIDELLSRLDLNDERRLGELYLAAYSRNPTTEEKGRLIEMLSATVGEQKKEIYQDLLWAFFNSQEFAYVH